MVQIFLIGIGAGLASALLFASVHSGVLASILLFYLAPLPIMIAALGWSHWAGLIAALVASTGISIADSFSSALFLLLGIGIPSWWLCYLAMLARPVATPAGNALEWYPIGRLVIWSAVLSALAVIGVLLSLGTSEAAIRDTLRRGFEIFLRRRDTQIELPGLSDFNARFDALIALAPPAAAVSATLLNLIAFWLSGRIVKLSGRLRRPWPELSAITLPAMTPNLLAVTTFCILLTGLVGIISSVFAASLATAYCVLGFAVLHAITRGRTNRSLMLAGAYVAALLWPALLLIALLGIADTAFDIRGRFSRKGGPPTLRT